MQKKALILLSGGLDSRTCLALAQEQGFECYTLSFNYGQKHTVEVEVAKAIAIAANVRQHKIVPLVLQGSSLTDTDKVIEDHTERTRIPLTYVPARNTVFLAVALSWAEVIGAFDIFIGINAVDYSGYPDCRPEYLRAFENLANLATKVSVEEGKKFEVHAPLLTLNKAEIIQQGIRLGVDYSKTVSCYRADDKGRACGNCDPCAFRKKGFAESRVNDPTLYVTREPAVS